MATATETVTPAFGRLDLKPGNAYPLQRVDYAEPSGFERLIAEHGYRLGWSRAAECPCKTTAENIDENSSTCPLCKNRRWLYYGAQEPQDLSGEALTSAQTGVIQRSNSFLIRGHMQNLSFVDDDTGVDGRWRTGQSQVTVFFDNNLMTRDRLINIDGQITYTEIVQAPESSTTPMPLRYIVSGGVYYMRSVEQVYQPGIDYTVRDGFVYFYSGSSAAPGTSITVNYATFPTYMVMSMPHAVRIQNVVKGIPKPANKMGSLQYLPLQAAVQLEFLPYDHVGST